MNNTYNGGLTREKFLFFETRTIASLIKQGMTRDEIVKTIHDENLFQFPTERMIDRFATTCFRRIDSLDSEELVCQLADAPISDAKQINLYAMMKDNRIVWDFMTGVIGEKYRTQAFDFSRKDLNVFFFQLQEQDDDVASWSDTTIAKIKQVLTRCLVECSYLDSRKDTQLNAITIAPVLEAAIYTKNDVAALPAFNCFK